MKKSSINLLSTDNEAEKKATSDGGSALEVAVDADATEDGKDDTGSSAKVVEDTAEVPMNGKEDIDTEEVAVDENDENKNVTGKQVRRKAIEHLLKITGGNIPELFNQVNDGLKELMRSDKSLQFDEKLSFSEANASFRIPNFSDSLSLDGSTDFFGMSIGKQELLYDRIGLFKGIIVDHSKETPVDQGFRNVVKSITQGISDSRTKPVKVFYKKPRLSGFFESSYTFDESQKKSEEAGIFNLGFGLSVNYSGFSTSVTARAGFSYGKDWLKETNIHVKKIDITSSFFLPKIDLSFDTLYPCASDEFIEAVEHVFSEHSGSNDLVKFDKLNVILMNFGHFLPTNLIVGGRLYSSDSKSISDTSEIENVVTQYSADFKVAVETFSADIGAEGKMQHSTTEKTARKNTKENQNLQLKAVGGEGAYVNNTDRWVESMSKFTSWGLVRFDNLVPSINVLPSELRQKCESLFLSIVGELTIEEILDRGAHYLFYKGYHEQFGSKAQPRFFVIKSIDSDRHVLSVVNGDLRNNAEVALKPYDEQSYEKWWLAPDGKLICKEGQGTTEEFVLAVQDNKLVINQAGFFDNQFWTIGGGKIINSKLNKKISISVKSDTNEQMIELKDSNTYTPDWKLVSEKELYKLREAIPKKPLKKLTGANVSVLKNNQYIDRDGELISTNSRFKLRLESGGLCIYFDDVLFWNYPCENAQKLLIADGKLVIERSNGEPSFNIASTINSYADSLELLDCGNLELANREGITIWESNSIMYSTISTGNGKGVLSVHHTDFAPDMSYDFIATTVMPFIGADHQLWYVSRKKQIVCKALKEGYKKVALSTDDSGNISLAHYSNIDNKQIWSLNASGLGAIKNLSTGFSLASFENGKMLKGLKTNSSNWEVQLASKYTYKKNAIIELKTAPVIDKENDDEGYLHFNDRFGDFIHLDIFDLQKNELRGIKIIKYNNRFAVRAIIENSHIQSSIWDEGNRYEQYDKKSFRLDRSPVYFPGKAKSLGLYKKGDKYALKAVSSDMDYTNNDDQAGLTLQHNGIFFVDTTPVIAANDETIVGFGFKNIGNRAAPYLLTMKK